MKFIADTPNSGVIVSLEQDDNNVDIFLNGYLVAYFEDGKLIKIPVDDHVQEDLRQYGIAFINGKIGGGK